jgi:glycosyltransferase involved in cell wall biosynthesis
MIRQNHVPEQKLRIVVFGVRTLPPSNGAAGSETVAEELYPRFVERGHQVVVYCRKYRGIKTERRKIYRGLQLIHLPTVRWQGFDTLLHSLLCVMHIIVYNTGDVLHIHNAGNSIWLPLLRLFRKRCFLVADGFDWKRDRWPFYAKLYLRMTAALAMRFPKNLIVDNVFVQRHYEEQFGVSPAYIPYGVQIKDVTGTGTLARLGLKKERYILFVGRFIPEKGVHYLINAFEQVDTDMKLVLVGGSLFGEEWVKKLKSTKDPRILFPGYLYGKAVDELLQHCYLYVQPSDVEGLSPVILRAMGAGRCVVSSDIPENRFLVEGHGHLFEKGSSDSLKTALNRLLHDPEEVAQKGREAQEFAKAKFSWDTVAEQHLALFMQV